VCTSVEHTVHQRAEFGAVGQRVHQGRRRTGDRGFGFDEKRRAGFIGWTAIVLRFGLRDSGIVRTGGQCRIGGATPLQVHCAGEPRRGNGSGRKFGTHTADLDRIGVLDTFHRNGIRRCGGPSRKH
jgi:hypothetical protein